MSSPTSPINNQLKTLEVCVLATAVLVTLITLVWLLIYSRYGINLTDESFYLIWMANPWIYTVSVTQFGFIYHPLHLLLHGDISLLRQTNILIIFGLAWGLCVVFFSATIGTSLSWRNLPMLALAGVTATCSLIYFCPYGWLATPSYNSLVFQALLLTSIGILLAEKADSPISITGWILIGVGGWLVFMAKPTSALALGFVISVCLPLTGKFSLRLFGIALLTAIILLIVSAWVIDDSLIRFIERLKGGAEALRLLEANHSLGAALRIDALLIERKEQFFLLFFGIITFWAIYLTTLKKKPWIIAGLGLTWLFALTSLVIISGYFLYPVKALSSLLILTVLLSTLAFSFILIRSLPYFKVSKIQWGIALYFAVLPHVSAFGTNNNYWRQGSLDSLFWVLAGLAILIPAIPMPSIQRTLLPVIVSGQLITVILLQTAMEQPYYGQTEAFRQYDSIVAIGTNESELMLPKDFADYYRNLKKLATQADFRSGTPMIDMTGQEPGTLYALGAKAIGSAWLIGGTYGSNNMARNLLNRVPCSDLTEAWLLVDPDGLAKLSPTILNRPDDNFEQYFEMTAELNIPPNSVVRWGIPARRLQLWKPIHSTQYTVATCEKNRIHQPK